MQCFSSQNLFVNFLPDNNDRKYTLDVIQIYICSYNSTKEFLISQVGSQHFILNKKD